MSKPKPRPKPATITPTWRDQVALQVMSICMADLSRQISSSAMQKQEVPIAVKFIAELAYMTADELIARRNRE